MIEIAVDWSCVKKDSFWRKQLENSRVLPDLPVQIQRDWNNASLREVDDFLRKHYKTISCADISAMYWKFWFDLKKIKSNSTNFVGYSEFLILRSLLHFLREEYFPNSRKECDSIPFSKADSPNNDLGYFALGNNDLLVATECIPKEFRVDWLKNRRPDIILYKIKPNPQIVAVIQIKSFPASAKIVEDDLEFLNILNSRHKVNGLVMIFLGCKKSFKDDTRVCKLYHIDKPISEVFRSLLHQSLLLSPEYTRGL